MNIGIIGTGLVAREHASAIASIGGQTKLIAATDASSERLEEFCGAFQIERSYDSAEKLLADDRVELVTVATPPNSHEELVVAALDAGKFVLCEKPLAHTLQSARRILAAEARHPGRLAVSYQFRYDSSFRRLQWFVENGWLGDVRRARVARHSFITSEGKDAWWGRWSVAGGGVLITQLIHEVDKLILVMGEPISVRSDMDTRFTSIESEDFVRASVTFESGAVAECVAAVNCGFLGGGLEFEGDLGV